jgi:hypothetical protein
MIRNSQLSLSLSLAHVLSHCFQVSVSLTCATQYSIISEAQRNDGILNLNSMSASAMPPQVLKDAIVLTMPTITLSLAKSIDKGLPHATAVERLGRQLVTMAGTAQQLEQTLDVYLHKQYYQNDIVEMYKKNEIGNSD